MLHLPQPKKFKEVIIIRTSILSVTFVLTLCLSGKALWATEWLWADDLAIGSRLPEFSVTNVNNADISVQSLYGKKGLLLFFSRSTEW
jgi:hypothetical protein